MKSKIRLPAAFSENLGRLAHISERLSRKDTFRCPFCNGEVGFKKREIRQHHFFHRQEANCNPSAETLLHEGAKAFLYSTLLSKKPIPLNIPDLKNLPKEIWEILEPLGLTGVSISTGLLPGFSMQQHEVEKTISNYRPDVLSTNFGSYFAWEIFVSHEIEEQKAEAFRKQKIPFIELIPSFREPSEYSFTVSAFEGFSLVDVKSSLMPRLFNSYRDDLLSIYNSKMNDEMRQTIERSVVESARNQAWNVFVDRIATHRGKRVIEALYKSGNLPILIARNFSIDVYCDGFEFRPDQKTVAFESAEIETRGDRSSIRVNKKYFISSPIRLLSGIVKFFSEQDYLRGIANDSKQLVGFVLEFPTVKRNKKTKKHLVLNNETVTDDDVCVEFINGRRSKNEFPYCIARTFGGGSYYVKNHAKIIVDLLNFLGDAAKTSVLLQKNEKGYPTVVGIRLSGVPDSNKLIETLGDFYRHVLETLLDGREA